MYELTDITLTDDEAVALAVETGRPWPSGLPTVDVHSERALAAAAMRGWRSFSVRNLSADVPALARRLAPVTAAAPRMDTYLADADLARLPSSTCSHFYALPDSTWAVELTTGAGVHVFRAVTDGAADQMLVSAVERAHQAGVSPTAGEANPAARFFCVASNRSDHLRLLVVGRGRLAMYRVADTVTALPAPRSSSEAIRLLQAADDPVTAAR